MNCGAFTISTFNHWFLTSTLPIPPHTWQIASIASRGHSLCLSKMHTIFCYLPHSKMLTYAAFFLFFFSGLTSSIASSTGLATLHLLIPQPHQLLLRQGSWTCHTQTLAAFHISSFIFTPTQLLRLPLLDLNTKLDPGIPSVHLITSMIIRKFFEHLRSIGRDVLNVFEYYPS